MVQRIENSVIVIREVPKFRLPLRLSPNKEKPQPRIVFRYSMQNYEIRRFLFCRRTVKRINLNLAERIK
jgi:hypothetical protein